MHHCLIATEDSLHAVSGTPSGTFRNLAEQRVGQVRSELAYAAVDDMIMGGLHQFLDTLQAKLTLAGDAIRDVFFAAPAAAPRARAEAPAAAWTARE